MMKVLSFETGKMYTFSLNTYNTRTAERGDDTFADTDPFSAGFCPAIDPDGFDVFVARQKDIDFVVDFYQSAADAWNDGKPGELGDPSELDDGAHYDRWGNNIPDEDYAPQLDEDGCPYEQEIFSVDVDDSDFDEEDLAAIRTEFLKKEAHKSW